MEIENSSEQDQMAKELIDWSNNLLKVNDS